jgi:hypothetical protein
LRALGEQAGGMQYPAVTMAIRRFTKRLETDVSLARKITRLRAMLLVDSAEKPFSRNVIYWTSRGSHCYSRG